MRPLVLGSLAVVAALGAAGCGGGAAGPTTTSPTGADASATGRGATVLLYRAMPAQGASVTPAAIARTVATFRRRLADLGVSGATVERSGGDRIAVLLGDRRTADRVKAGLGGRGELAFYDWEANVLGEDGRPHPADAEVTGGMLAGAVGAGTLRRADAARRAARARTRARRAVVVRVAADPQAGRAVAASPRRYLALADRVALRGTDLVDPRPATDATTGRPNVTFGFTPAGAVRWRRLTRAVARRGAAQQEPGASGPVVANHFAIVLDGRVVSVPYIDPQFNPDGVSAAHGAQISGNFTREDTRTLAALLKTGPLPLTLELLAERPR